MKQSFYTWTAVAFFASTALVGCVVEESDADNTDGGTVGTGATGGTGGSAGGTGATGGSAGSTAGTGATGGSAGTTGGSAGAGATGGSGATGGTTGGTGGTPACLDDTASITVDCANLSYASTMCDDGGDAGTVSPAGVYVCDFSAAYARPGVHEGLYNCLAAITADPCSASHDTAAGACYDAAFAAACDTTSTQPAGGTCADIAASCPGAAATCEARYDGYTSAIQAQIADCYNLGTGECAADFLECTQEPFVNDPI